MRRETSGGVAASYSGSAHFELDEFNLQYPLGTVWIDYTLSPKSFLRGRYDVGHAWLGLNPYVLTQNAAAEWHRNWGEWGNSEVALLWDWLDFQFDRDLLAPGDPALAAARDRTGQGVGAAFRHRQDVGRFRNDFIRRFEWRASYTYRRYWAKGTEWDYNWHDLQAGFEMLMPWKLDLDVWGGVGIMPFDNPSTYDPPQTEDRRDINGYFGSELERPLGDIFSVSARYTYLRNDSNVVVFDYSRHIVGGYLNARF